MPINIVLFYCNYAPVLEAAITIMLSRTAMKPIMHEPKPIKKNTAKIAMDTFANILALGLPDFKYIQFTSNKSGKNKTLMQS